MQAETFIAFLMMTNYSEQIILKLLRFVNFTSVLVCQAWCYVIGLKDLSKNFIFIWSCLRRLSNPAGFIVCLFGVNVSSCFDCLID